MTTTTILSDNGVSSGTAGIKTTGGNDGTLVLQTTTSGGVATTALTLNNVQGVSVPNTFGVGGATPSTSGAGITFPATQSASSDANTLDDYEEGTWTPVWGAASGGSMSYASQVGRYVKVGRLVTATCHVVTSANNALSGSVYLSGLPFTSDSTSNNYVACAVHVEQVNLAASAWIWAYVAPNTTLSYWRYWVNNGPAGNLQGSSINAASDIMITCNYITT